MGLRFKLGLSVLLLVVAVLAVTSYLWMHSERRIFVHEMRNRGIALLRAFAIPCANAMANNDMPLLDNFIVQFGEAKADMEVRYLAVLDDTGRVAAHTNPTEFGRTYNDSFTQRALLANGPVTQITKTPNDTLLEIAVPVATGLRWGTLRAGFTLSGIEQAAKRDRRRLIIMGISIALGSILLAYGMLSRFVVKPVVRMRNMAQRFGAGQLAARVTSHDRDEMGELAGSLNSMAQQIQTYAVSLERLVQERTSELASANRQLRDVNETLERLATTDGLTGLYNRRYFLDQLEFELQRGMRTAHHEFALILLDIDYFKSFNDTYGHSKGDELLQHVSRVLQENLRSTDVVARYGGEEFIILLLDTDPAQGEATAKKLRALVAETPLCPPTAGAMEPGVGMGHGNGVAGSEGENLCRVTVSVGLAFYPYDASDTRTLIDFADQALYRSKQTGRDRVTTWNEVHAVQELRRTGGRQLEQIL